MQLELGEFVKSVDILSRIVEMHESGAVGDEVIDELLSGLEFVTARGTGTFRAGMLSTSSGLVSFGKITSVRCCSAAPARVITTRITTVPASGKVQAAPPGEQVLRID